MSDIKTAPPVVVPGTSNGLVSLNGVPGNTTGSAITAGYVGESKIGSRLRSAATGLTPGLQTDIASITLNKGIWLMWGQFGCNPAAGTVVTNLNCELSANGSLNSPPDGTGDGRDGSANYWETGGITNGQEVFPLGPIVVTVAADGTVFYLVVQPTFSVSTMTGYGKIAAIRIA